MASWRVVCVKRWTASYPEPHSHVVGVGTGDRADWADMRWSLDQVLTAMDEGDTFFTQGETTGQAVPVERYICPVCERLQIRSAEEYGPGPRRYGNAPQCNLTPPPLPSLPTSSAQRINTA